MRILLTQVYFIRRRPPPPLNVYNIIYSNLNVSLFYVDAYKTINYCVSIIIIMKLRILMTFLT